MRLFSYSMRFKDVVSLCDIRLAVEIRIRGGIIVWSNSLYPTRYT